MQLIDFILDNLFFVILALSFLVSMLTRKKKEEEQSRRTTPTHTAPQPSTAGQSDGTLASRQTPARTTGTTMDQRPTSRQPAAEKPLASDRLREMEARIEQLRDRRPQGGALPSDSPISSSEVGAPYERPYDNPYERATDSPYERRTQAPFARPSLDSETRRIRDSSAFTVRSFASGQLPRQAVEGMMWSEVFGSPRSRKPYRPRNWRR